MIPGRLLVVLAARAGHRVLERLAPGSLDQVRSAAVLDAAIAGDLSRSDYLGPYTPPSLDADQLHHGSWELNICMDHGRVTVVPPAGLCPECDSTPAAAGDPAGVSPAAVSDGLATTAPAAGHPNPMHDAAAADARISGLISQHNARVAAFAALGRCWSNVDSLET